jgi:hypothetical protein
MKMAGDLEAHPPPANAKDGVGKFCFNGPDKIRTCDLVLIRRPWKSAEKLRKPLNFSTLPNIERFAIHLFLSRFFALKRGIGKRKR